MSYHYHAARYHWFIGIAVIITSLPSLLLPFSFSLSYYILIRHWLIFRHWLSLFRHYHYWWYHNISQNIICSSCHFFDIRHCLHTYYCFNIIDAIILRHCGHWCHLLLIIDTPRHLRLLLRHYLIHYCHCYATPLLVIAIIVAAIVTLIHYGWPLRWRFITSYYGWPY